MDWDADARREVLDSLRDLNEAEAMLAALKGGSHEHVLMAEAVARLSEAAYDAVRKAAQTADLH